MAVTLTSCEGSTSHSFPVTQTSFYISLRCADTENLSDPYDPNPFLNIPAYSCDWPLVDETIAKKEGRSVARTPVCLSVVCEVAEQKRYEKMLKFKERARERLANGLPLDHNSSKFNLKPDTFHY